MSNRMDVEIVTTDVNGKFSFQPRDKKYAVFAESDDGFAVIKGEDFEKSGKLQLQKWARIEGDVRMNASPAKNAEIGASTENSTGDWRDRINVSPQTTRTDDNGHFVLDRLPPCENTNVMRLVPIGSRSKSYVYLGVIATKPGETSTVRFGGKGRPIIGKIVPPDGVAFPDASSMSLNISPMTGSDPMFDFMKQVKYPENFPDFSPAEQQQFRQKLTLDPAYQAAVKKMVSPPQDRIVFVEMPDGMIRADDVEPGTYQFGASLRGEYDRSLRNSPLLGMGQFSVTVPPGGPTDEPIDVGTVQLTAPATIQTDKPLPVIELVVPDGQPIDPKTWAGKVTVIHFWQMETRTLFPAINALAEKYKNDPKVAIVNVGTFMFPAWVAHITAHDPLKGLATLDKDSYNLDSRMAYTHHPEFFQIPMPYVILVDAKGIVVGQFTDKDKLTAAVEAAVGQ